MYPVPQVWSGVLYLFHVLYFLRTLGLLLRVCCRVPCKISRLQIVCSGLGRLGLPFGQGLGFMFVHGKPLGDHRPGLRHGRLSPRTSASSVPNREMQQHTLQAFLDQGLCRSAVHFSEPRWRVGQREREREPERERKRERAKELDDGHGLPHFVHV